MTSRRTMNLGSKPGVQPTLRKFFFTGLFFLFPIGVTYWTLNFLITSAQGYTRPMVNWVLEKLSIDGTVPDPILTTISVLLVLWVVIVIGWLANFYFGKKILNAVDHLILKVPFIRSIYGGTKQIIEAFSLQQGAGSFKKVVMLEYPRRGSWVLGFVTNENLDRAKRLYGRGLVGVFVPSTPNPTTGFLLYLEPYDLHLVDLGVEEAIKLIVSAGLVLPVHNKRLPITLGEDMEQRLLDQRNAEQMLDPEEIPGQKEA